MRILVIHNHYKEAGGEDTVFFAETALLKAHGQEVKTLALSNNDVQSLSQKIEAAVGVVYNFRSARLIEKELEEFKPDVVHVHNFFPLISPAVFYVCHKYNIPVVMTLHNYRLICPSALLHYNGKVQLENIHKTFPLGAIRKKVYRNSAFQTASVVLATGLHKLLGTWRDKVSKFIVLTPGAKELFSNSSLQLQDDQLVVKPNFTDDPGVGEAEREDYFLYIGRLTPEKGIKTLLDAQKQAQFKLKIIGDGPLRGFVKGRANDQPNVEYLGYKKREETTEILKKAKALIFPSEWMETFGMTVVEAFATATPVIAANIGGGAHLVKHLYNGLHFKPQNAVDLIAQVKVMQDNPIYVREMGLNARKTYEQQFTPDVNYYMLIDIYRAAAGKVKRPTSTSKAEVSLLE